MEKPILYLVIPCYNEERVLPKTAPLFEREVRGLIASGKISSSSKIMFVNDGSSDDTWQIIQSLVQGDGSLFLGICLSRNRGHQNALLAGLMEVRHRCDACVSIDCDGQDDIAAIEDMVDAYLDGCDIVYGVRSSRDTDTFFKRTSAQVFYSLLTHMGVDTVYNHADYRLLSARVLDELAKYREVNLFLRGMIPLIGFKSTSVYYERHERMAGYSHYPLNKMVALAVDGITSLSIKPIRVITFLGLFVSIISFIGVIWAVIVSLMGRSVAGWSSMMSILCFIGGIQLLSLGVIGEYIGKIYMEAKHRPRFIVSERVGFTPDDTGAPEGPSSKG